MKQPQGPIERQARQWAAENGYLLIPRDETTRVSAARQVLDLERSSIRDQEGFDRAILYELATKIARVILSDNLYRLRTQPSVFEGRETIMSVDLILPKKTAPTEPELIPSSAG